MAEPQNDFSWSKAREASFRRCPRQYWFYYYGSRGGWDRRSDGRTRTIYVLKKLDTRKLWLGTTVHNCIRWVLDELRLKNELPPEEKTLQFLGKRMQKDFTESGEGLYWEDPKTFRGLQEHEYDDRDVPDEEWQDVFEKALLLVSTFYHSDVFENLQVLPKDAWLDVDERCSFRLDGIRLRVQLDCAHRENGDLVFYDWHTGDPEAVDTREQLAACILYAAQQWNIPHERVIAREYNLGHDALRETRMTADELAAARIAIMNAAAEMQLLHDAPEDKFAFTENEDECSRCNFTRICPKFAAEAQRSQGSF